MGGPGASHCPEGAHCGEAEDLRLRTAEAQRKPTQRHSGRPHKAPDPHPRSTVFFHTVPIPIFLTHPSCLPLSVLYHYQLSRYFLLYSLCAPSKVEICLISFRRTPGHGQDPHRDPHPEALASPVSGREHFGHCGHKHGRGQPPRGPHRRGNQGPEDRTSRQGLHSCSSSS